MTKVLKSTDYIDEKLAIKPVTKTRLSDIKKANRERHTYRIAECEVFMAEDNYINGEDEGISFPFAITHIKTANSLEDLLRNFNDDVCRGHAFDIEDFVYDPETDGRVEMSVMSMLIITNFNFKEPTQNDWKRFKEGKINMTSLVFQLLIEKDEFVDDISEDCEKIGIISM